MAVKVVSLHSAQQKLRWYLQGAVERRRHYHQVYQEPARWCRSVPSLQCAGERAPALQARQAGVSCGAVRASGLPGAVVEGTRDLGQIAAKLERQARS